MEFSSLINLLEKQSQKYCEEKKLLYFADGEVNSDHRTFLELMGRAKKIGSFLLKHHKPGDIVLLPFASSLEFIDAFFGVIYAGMVGVPCPAMRAKKKDSRIDMIIEDARPVCILQATSKQMERVGESCATNNIAVYSIECILTENIEIKAPIYHELAYLQYTSGSTSLPKGVEISHENVLRNCALIGRAIGLNSNDSIVTWLPHFHDMGLVGGIIVPIFYGVAMYMMPPASFIQKPQRWLNLISKQKATVSVAPNFAYDFCEKKIRDEEIINLDLSRWRAALNGSEPIIASTLKGFIDKFSKYGFSTYAICGSYGMAEATLGVTMQSPGCDPFFAFDKDDLHNGKLTKSFDGDYMDYRKTETLVSCGSIDSEVDVKIVNLSTLSVCGEGEIGEIWVNSSSVSKGYWRKPQATLESFAIKLDGDKKYFRTGDFGGFFNGELFVTGRIKEILIIRGRNYFPQDIELYANRSHPLLSSYRSVVFEDQNKDIVVIQELPNPNIDISYLQLAQLIRANIFNELELDIREVLFVQKKNIPLTTSGKLQRQKCKMMYENNNFHCIAREFPEKKLASFIENPSNIVDRRYVPPRDKIEFSLVEIVDKVLGIKNISAPDNLMDYGIESIKIVEFVEALNNSFGKDFSLSTVIDNPSIESIAITIRTETVNKQESSFIVLKKGGVNKFVFCIHTIGGNPYIYYELSQKFSDDYTVYGVQAKGLEEGEEPYQSVESMAKSYLNQIVEINPHGEILIVGYSSAALIAYEVAYRLQREARRKVFLCFIDPLSPSAIRDTRSVDDIELQFRATLGEALIKNEAEWIQYWEANRKEISAIKTDQDRLLFLEKQLVLAPSVFFPDFGEKRLRRFLSTYMSLYKALLQYSPGQVFRGKIHVLGTDSNDFILPKSGSDEAYGWAKNATEGIVIKNVSGKHLSILSEPTVSVVGNVIKDWIC